MRRTNFILFLSGKYSDIPTGQISMELFQVPIPLVQVFSRNDPKLPLILAVTGSGWEYPEHESHWGDSCADQERGSPIDFRFLYELNKYRNRVTTSALSVRLVINGWSQT